ncbi:ABC transporter substrate-binding protein [Caballeronia mineralivorans PML1(12)]|uniref:ABC transporter substrate-binding protein n=1 Tax=Caballeronia mineralivorans PML1(12) TaxID=908627 RepID=A0A0J1CIT0_9BURK|nr:sugar-binding protein [Caballeronia mineralivorans]KLU20386.1 ABC transporter substrate-binding protein [Caballeronia mineralivorans PML1(12)]
MKKALLPLLALGAALCVQSLTARAEDVYALVPKAMNNPYFDLARDGCNSVADKLKGAKCLYIGPSEANEQEQIQIIQDLITRHVKGIAVSPANAPAIARALKSAQDAGIPTITWDSDLLPQDKSYRQAYVGTKNYDIGVNLAKLLQQMKPKGGKICLQSGGAAAANHNERLQGIRDTLAGTHDSSPPGNRLTGQHGWTEVDGCPLFTDDDSAKADQQLSDILTKYGNQLDAFVSTGAFTQWSDNAYRQAVQSMLPRIKSKQLVVLVADTLPMQLQQLKDGYSNGNVGQRPFEMGAKAVLMLQDISSGKKVSDTTYTGIDVCTADNVNTCLKH